MPITDRDTIEIEKIIESIRFRRVQEIVAFHNSSASYAQLAVRSALALNGGGLIALPTFLAAIYKEGQIREILNEIIIIEISFLIGVVCAVICSYFSYRNFHRNIEIAKFCENFDVYELKNRCGIATGEDYEKINEEYKEYESKAFAKAHSTYILGNLCGFLSYIAFFAGCLVVVCAISEEGSVLDWICVFGL